MGNAWNGGCTFCSRKKYARRSLGNNITVIQNNERAKKRSNPYCCFKRNTYACVSDDTVYAWKFFCGGFTLYKYMYQGGGI